MTEYDIFSTVEDNSHWRYTSRNGLQWKSQIEHINKTLNLAIASLGCTKIMQNHEHSPNFYKITKWTSNPFENTNEQFHIFFNFVPSISLRFWAICTKIMQIRISETLKNWSSSDSHKISRKLKCSTCYHFRGFTFAVKTRRSQIFTQHFMKELKSSIFSTTQ